VRRVSDLAYQAELEAAFADDPLVGEMAQDRFAYVPTVTREPFRTSGRIDTLIETGEAVRAAR
jgi:ferredoxin--NADP+ reductase